MGKTGTRVSLTLSGIDGRLPFSTGSAVWRCETRATPSLATFFFFLCVVVVVVAVCLWGLCVLLPVCVPPSCSSSLISLASLGSSSHLVCPLMFSAAAAPGECNKKKKRILTDIFFFQPGVIFIDQKKKKMTPSPHFGLLGREKKTIYCG